MLPISISFAFIAKASLASKIYPSGPPSLDTVLELERHEIAHVTYRHLPCELEVAMLCTTHQRYILGADYLLDYLGNTAF